MRESLILILEPHSMLIAFHSVPNHFTPICHIDIHKHTMRCFLSSFRARMQSTAMRSYWCTLRATHLMDTQSSALVPSRP